MLAKGLQAPAWTNQGYICLSCRQHRALRVDRRQTRHNSTEVASNPRTEDGIFALNDISDDFGDEPRDERSSSSSNRRETSHTSPIASLLSTLDASRPRISKIPIGRHTSASTDRKSGKARIVRYSTGNGSYKSLHTAYWHGDRHSGSIKSHTTSSIDIDTILQSLRPDLEKELKQTAAAMDQKVERRERETILSGDISREPIEADRALFSTPAMQSAGANDNTSSGESITASDDYKIVDRVDELQNRPRFGGDTSSPSAQGEVFFFDTFRKKAKEFKAAPPAIATKPFGLPSSITPTQVSSSAQEDPKEAHVLKRLWGLLGARPKIDGVVGDAIAGPSDTSAANKDDASFRYQENDGTLKDSFGLSVEQAMQRSVDIPSAVKDEKRRTRKTRITLPTANKARRVNASRASDAPQSTTTSKRKAQFTVRDIDSGHEAAPVKPSASTSETEKHHGSTAPPPADDPPKEPTVNIKTLKPKSLEIKPLDFPQPPVPLLEYGLDRVLFNPGVYQLQDKVSRVYNFDPYLQNIMPIVEFDFNSLKEYKTSSEDQTLVRLARKNQSRYIGSTSSMTSSLSHFHQLLSNMRPLSLDMLSSGFVTPNTTNQLTAINRAPSAIFLRWKNGTYAIDADKEYDSANVLMLLGKSMELLLTQPKSQFERYRKSDPRAIPDEERQAPETYQYTTMRDFLMRSQLDAHDPRLPDTGNFDLKTRAVVTIRMQSHDHEEMTGYELLSNQGRWFSYEKEYYDMIRSTMLKYMLQARMGRMNGIFVAYHNVERIFGFQYVSMAEMDKALHGQSDPTLGDQEFRASLDLLNEVLNKATAKFPKQSLRIHFETVDKKGDMPTSLHIFAEPMTEEEIDTIQDKSKAKIAEFERSVMRKEGTGLDKAVKKATKNVRTASQMHPDDVDTLEGGSAFFSSDVEQNDEATAEIVSEDQEPSTEDILPAEEALPEDDATSYAREKVNTPDVSTVDKSNSVDASTSDELRPLFYATVIVQSTVNGRTPKDGRPTNLRPRDKWEIDYILKEYDITRHQWALYEDMKSRRRFALSSNADADELEVPQGVKTRKTDQKYIQTLKKFSEQGRLLRNKWDEKDEGNEVIRVDDPVNRLRVDINSVDDYLAWMCGNSGK